MRLVEYRCRFRVDLLVKNDHFEFVGIGCARQDAARLYNLMLREEEAVDQDSDLCR